VSIFSKKVLAHPKWLEAFKLYESISGLEPDQEGIDSGKITIKEAWDSSQQTFYSIGCDVSNIRTPDESEMKA